MDNTNEDKALVPSGPVAGGLVRAADVAAATQRTVGHVQALAAVNALAYRSKRQHERRGTAPPSPVEVARAKAETTGQIRTLLYMVDGHLTRGAGATSDEDAVALSAALDVLGDVATASTVPGAALVSSRAAQLIGNLVAALRRMEAGRKTAKSSAGTAGTAGAPAAEGAPTPQVAVGDLASGESEEPPALTGTPPSLGGQIGLIGFAQSMCDSALDELDDTYETNIGQLAEAGQAAGLLTAGPTEAQVARMGRAEREEYMEGLIKQVTEITGPGADMGGMRHSLRAAPEAQHSVAPQLLAATLT